MLKNGTKAYLNVVPQVCEVPKAKGCMKYFNDFSLIA